MSRPKSMTDDLPDPARMLMWNEVEKIAGNRNMKSLFAVEEFANDPRNIKPLPHADILSSVTYRAGGQACSLDDYLRRQNVTGLLVIKDRSIVVERYAYGNTERTRWTSWSVGKSILSTLVGIALKDGHIRNLDMPITHYVGELLGSAYDGVTLRHMLQMSSGVKWSEDPSDPPPNVADFAQCLVERKAGSVLALAGRLTRAIDPKTGAPAMPGAVWNYSNIDAFIIGVALQRAIGGTLAKYVQEKIWKPCGMEETGFWMSESNGGMNSGAGDFSAILRDYGRLAMFIMEGGVLPDGTCCLPNGWMREATTWAAQSADPAVPAASSGRYGYLWWYLPVAPGLGMKPEATPTSHATFSAVGLFGQYVFINPMEKLLMVQWSAYPQPQFAVPAIETATFFNALSEALH